MIYKIIFSIIFILLLILKIFFNKNIDNTTIIIVILIFIPWIIEMFSEIEIPNIIKFSLKKKEKEELEKNALDVEKVLSKHNIEKQDNIYMVYIDDDPKFALAKIRMQIEELLRKICNKNSIAIDRRSGIAAIAEILISKEKITHQEYALIKDLIGILNRAVHSNLNRTDIESYNSVIKYSDILMKSLQTKI